MIRIFKPTDTNFTSNGDIVLKPLKARVHKEDNGDYYLNLETSLDYVDYIVENNIVVANTPTGDQAFRIGNVIKTKNKLSTKAYHVFYDSERYVIADSYVVEKNCNAALDHLNAATEPTSPFTTYSDIDTIDSYRCVRKSLYEAFNEVVNRWHGHLVRDNFNVSVMTAIGVDNGITVQYKKNLKEITCEENWDDVITKILPVGKDGTLLNAVNPSASIYIESDVHYSVPYTKTVSFSQDINEDDYESEAAYKTALVNDLRTQATAYLKINAYPQVNYSLRANLEKLTDIGDIIKVIDEPLGIDLLTSVIAFDYDCISEKYTQVEFGNFARSLSDLVSYISSSAEKAAVSASTQYVDDNFVMDNPIFTEAATRTNIQSGEKFSIILGKIKKFFSDLKAVAFSGSYNDLSDTPTIPTVNDGNLKIYQDGSLIGTFSANQSQDEEVHIAGGGGGGGTYTEGDGIDISNLNVISVDTTFTEASTRANIDTGDPFATILGKIKKFFTDLKTVAFTGSYDDLTNKPSIPVMTDYVLKSGDTMTGPLTIKSSTGNYREGLRVNRPSATTQWADITIGSTADSGISDYAWFIGTPPSTYGRQLRIAHNNSETNTYFYADGSTRNSPALYLGWSGDIASADSRAVNGDKVFNYIASGISNRDEHNANNAVKNGMYYYTSNGPATSIGASTTDGALYVQQYSASWVAQIAQDYRNGRMFVRGKNNGTWQSWVRIANYNEFVPATGGGTFSASSGDTPIIIKGDSSGAYIAFKTSDGTTRGYFGVRSDNKPYFYDTAHRAIITSLGGTISGTLAMGAGNSILLYKPDNSDNASIAESSNGTLHITTPNWMNLRGGNQVQVRNRNDSAWQAIYASAFTVQSSRRYKENIEDIDEDEAKKILDVRVVRYDYKENVIDSDRERYDRHGVIAEEVVDILPEVVNFAIPYGMDDVSEPIPEGVDYARFVPYLIKMVQMQQAEIEELKQLIAEK